MANKDDPGYPYGEWDAGEWAKEFKRINPYDGPDEDTMRGWFANAIMTGWDAAMKNSPVVSGYMRHVVPLITDG